MIGLIDVDSHHYPNLPLMKISSWYKSQGEEVEWFHPFRLQKYRKIFVSKVFSDSQYFEYIWDDAAFVYYGGTGFINGAIQKELEEKRALLEFQIGKKEADKRPVFVHLDRHRCYWDRLPDDMEHRYPDYSLYGLNHEAYGFLSRGCPRKCGFCIVSQKEGDKSIKAADLEEFYKGQKRIVLMDPNILACPEHPKLLGQLMDSKAKVNINQGLDARLLTEKNTDMIRKIQIERVHFAWDDIRDEERILPKLQMFKEMTGYRREETSVYILTNYNTSIEEDLYRIYKLRDMDFDPYVMVYDKRNAPQIYRALQRWVNAKKIFRTVKRFEEFYQRR